MRSLFAIAAVLLGLFFAAAPAEAACAGDNEPAVSVSVTPSSASVAALATGGHCHHIPCSDKNHSHLSGGCAGHSFVPAFVFDAPCLTLSAGRFAFSDETASGRTLLPPVPPPLV